MYVIRSSEESSDPEASAVSHPGWRAALAERRQQVGEMDEWPQPKAAAKPPGRTQRTAPPPLPKGSSSSTDEVDSEDGENGKTLQSIYVPTNLGASLSFCGCLKITPTPFNQI